MLRFRMMRWICRGFCQRSCLFHRPLPHTRGKRRPVSPSSSLPPLQKTGATLMDLAISLSAFLMFPGSLYTSTQPHIGAGSWPHVLCTPLSHWRQPGSLSLGLLREGGEVIYARQCAWRHFDARKLLDTEGSAEPARDRRRQLIGVPCFELGLFGGSISKGCYDRRHTPICRQGTGFKLFCCHAAAPRGPRGDAGKLGHMPARRTFASTGMGGVGLPTSCCAHRPVRFGQVPDGRTRTTSPLSSH